MTRPTLVLAALALLLSGCAVSRSAEVKAHAQSVESRLIDQRDRLAVAPVAFPDRAQRLDHLTGLRTQLSLANIARGLVPQLLRAPDQRDSAYDVLDEVYSTIDWNIPLLPTDTQRPLPPLFRGPQGLDFNALSNSGPVTGIR